MRKKRIKKDNITLNEGVYDFYEVYDPAEKGDTADKITNYYLDKIRKYGLNSLTKQETQIFNDAKKGKLGLDNPVYKRNKLTNDIETDNMGNAVRLDQETILPGMPFLTSKGRGVMKKEVIKGRCYWNVDEEFKTFYVFNGSGELVIWKTVSTKGKDFGAFVVPKGEAGLSAEELWKNLNKKFDKGVILDKDTYLKFLEFDDIFHNSKKEKLTRITELYDILKLYPQK